MSSGASIRLLRTRYVMSVVRNSAFVLPSVSADRKLQAPSLTILFLVVKEQF